MSTPLRSRMILWAVVAVAAVALAAIGGAAIASGDSSAAPKTRTLHFLLRENQQVLDRAPAGPSNGDLVLLRGDLLNPNTRRVVGKEIGMYVMADASNDNRSAASFVFTPNATSRLAQADEITGQAIFDSVPGKLAAAITGGSGKYQHARGEIVSSDGPDGLIDVVIHLSTE